MKLWITAHLFTIAIVASPGARAADAEATEAAEVERDKRPPKLEELPPAVQRHLERWEAAKEKSPAPIGADRDGRRSRIERPDTDFFAKDAEVHYLEAEVVGVEDGAIMVALPLSAEAVKARRAQPGADRGPVASTVLRIFRILDTQAVPLSLVERRKGQKMRLGIKKDKGNFPFVVSIGSPRN